MAVRLQHGSDIGSKLPKKFWFDKKHQRIFLDWFAKQANLQKPEDWYKIESQDVLKKGGYGLLNFHYNGSLPKALQTIYPDVKWQMWRFKKTPQVFGIHISSINLFYDRDFGMMLEIRKIISNGWLNNAISALHQIGIGMV
jgi:hypothetical protein